jgi:hypothetical protein
MAAVAELANDVGTSAACQALCMPRASYYRDGRKTSSPAVSASRPSPARALRPAERDAVLARLHEERFQDRSPAAVYCWPETGLEEVGRIGTDKSACRQEIKR